MPQTSTGKGFSYGKYLLKKRDKQDVIKDLFEEDDIAQRLRAELEALEEKREKNSKSLEEMLEEGRRRAKELGAEDLTGER